ncbi:hypothetical protein GE107_16290 [Cohnella sp. CFH 77786]|uniref:hypothetical protein n=1 Tax=Cohnella sp. CFH 77786 TaxID=2662265 RepID=UPI001C60FCE8|nr:hypothetical protein [Cohnella sp. CFH 77786]MBW5447618.1 hypothetical protein [Cohnella sp. CFH 77786]
MSYRLRLNEMISKAANQVWSQPHLEGGLWFHEDIRNNFYYSSYLAAAALDESIPFQGDREKALHTAWEVLHGVLSLQNRNPDDAMYGHWPLGLAPSPAQAEPNPLPAELMGLLMVYFHSRYGSVMPDSLNREFTRTFEALLCSSFYRVPIQLYNHHEAKYTAAKLIYGHRFQDDGLFKDGRDSLTRILERLREKGMPEYGGLPWFWHWVQAFTCVLELVEDAEATNDVRELLDYLWAVRADYYLGGAWAGARSRSLPHDLPCDLNVAFDYVQFGDFDLPERLARVEYAGLLFYPAKEETRRVALDRSGKPRELKRAVYPENRSEDQPLHSYLYRTDKYAIGGMWERVREFDNEQHRWELTLPLRGRAGVNRLYFFQPGEGYREGDPRHESDGGEVLYHQNVVIALYPSGSGGEDRLIGILPKGKWVCRREGLYGYLGGVYVAIHLPEGYSLSEETDRYVVNSRGMPSYVVVEAVDEEELDRWPAGDLEAFANDADQTLLDRLKRSTDLHSIEYVSLRGDRLALSVGDGGTPARSMNGVPMEDR